MWLALVNICSTPSSMCEWRHGLVEERRTAFHCAVTVHSCVYTRHFLFIGRLYIGFVGCHMKKKKKKLRSGTGLASALVGDKLNRNIHICWAVSIYIYIIWFVWVTFVVVCARLLTVHPPYWRVANCTVVCLWTVRFYFHFFVHSLASFECAQRTLKEEKTKQEKLKIPTFSF